MPFREDALRQVHSKKFDDVESLWMAELDRDPSDVDAFITVAKALRKAEQRTQSDTLLGLLSDSLKEGGHWLQRLHVLKELGRLSKHPAQLRQQFEDALKKAFGTHKNFARAFQFAKFNDPQSNPVERAEKIETWLTYDEGECFFMSGRGAGRVTELNPELGVCRLDFEKDKRVSVPLGAANKFLTPLPAGHILREKFQDPEGLQTQATKKPAEFFAKLLQSFGRPMTMAEVRDAVIGVVPEKSWTSWWTSARKNPQIVVSGSGAKATYSYSSSAGEAEGVVRRDFERADAKSRLELARKHSARSQELANFFSTALAADAARLARTDSAMSWQILTTLESLPGKYESTIEPASLLQSPMASRTVAAIGDKQLRERAIGVVRETHPDWHKVYSELFFLEEEPKMITLVYDALETAGETDLLTRLTDETLRYPRRHPRAFYWYAKRVNEDESWGDRATYQLLFQLLDALTNDEFSSVRARLKDFFDKGALAIRIINTQNNEEQARRIVDTLDRYGAVEEYRREIVKAAALMKHPHLREQEQEPVYSTPDMLEKKRAELQHLRNVEIPANSKALQAAREMGDLRENFEYKAARQRAEYLAARAAELSGELSRVRVLEAGQIDTTAVRVGTKLLLSNGELQREVVILGPWESAPEHGIYSNQSEVAKALLGHATGDIVSFMGNDYQIESIRKWTD
ncbi:MAG TPA: GreA/GreB family elongation factor [Thermoanaerobaculia bacterium]|jgi:transcription elongation GreA/GreB family factor